MCPWNMPASLTLVPDIGAEFPREDSCGEGLGWSYSLERGGQLGRGPRETRGERGRA